MLVQVEFAGGVIEEVTAVDEHDVGGLQAAQHVCRAVVALDECPVRPVADLWLRVEINGREAPVHDVHELIDFGHVNRAGPTGYGRFIFRLGSIPKDINIALPYLDGRSLAVLVGDNAIDQQLPASILINVQQDFPERVWDDAAENEIIHAYSPQAFKLATGFGPRPNPTAMPVPIVSKLRLALNVFNRRWIAAQIRAIRKQGLLARLQVLKGKLGL